MSFASSKFWCFTLAFSFVLCGCGQQYTRHVDHRYRGGKFTSKKIAVLPAMDLRFSPPTGMCVGPPKFNRSQVESKWQEELKKKMSEKFKEHQFIPVTLSDVENAGLDGILFHDKMAKKVDKTPLTLVPITETNALDTVVKLGNDVSLVQDWDKLDPGQEWDLIIALTKPTLSGRIETNHTGMGAGFGTPGAGGGFGTPGAAGFGGGTTTSTVYSSDVQISLWNRKSGELVYVSGALAESKGYCFVDPITGSLVNSGTETTKRLGDILAKILEKELGRVAVTD